MANQPKVFPLFDAITNALGQAWARFAERQFEPLARWAIMHIDQDGALQRDTVDILEAMPLQRLILVRQGPGHEPRVIRVSRIMEAIDVPTGRKVMLDRWILTQTEPADGRSMWQA